MHTKKKKKIKIPQSSIQHKNNTSMSAPCVSLPKPRVMLFREPASLQDKALGIIAVSSTTPAQGAADRSSRGSFLWGEAEYRMAEFSTEKPDSAGGATNARSLELHSQLGRGVCTAVSAFLTPV